MAKYNKIFWLDDRPDFLEFFFRDCSLLEREELFSRITWSHDFEEGAQKVYGNYDLYILDADFPDRINAEERKDIKDCLKKIENNLWCDRLLGLENTVTNNFARFYRQFLTGKNNVVVLSMSTLAPLVAFALGLPFYCKGGLDKEECKNDVQLWRNHIRKESEIEAICMHAGVDKKSLDLSCLDAYECGAAIHFIERYLL